MEASVVNRTIIRYVPAFAGLSDAECDALLPLVRERRLAAHEVLFRQGESGDALAIVHHGLLSVRVRRPDGSDAEVARVGEGEVLGELCFVDPAPRSATVVAEAASLVCELTSPVLRHLREAAPGLYATVMASVIRDITRRTREVDARIVGLLAPPGAAPSQSPPRAGASQAPPRAGASQAPPRGSARPAPQESAQEPGALPEVHRPSAGCVVTISAAQLRTLPSLGRFTDHELQVLATVATPRPFAAGTVLIREGEPGRSCLILGAGELEVVKRIGERDVVVAVLRAGALVGQIALVDRAPRSATVRARTAGAVLELARDDFERLLGAHSPLALRFQEQIATAGARQLRASTEELAKVIEATGAAPGLQSVDALTAMRVSLDEWGMPKGEAQG